MSSNISSVRQTRPPVRKRFLCPAIYKCKCEGRPRAKVTSLKHKKIAEDVLRAEGRHESNCVLPLPQPYNTKPRNLYPLIYLSSSQTSPAPAETESKFQGNGVDLNNDVDENAPGPVANSSDASQRNKTNSKCDTSFFSSENSSTPPDQLINDSPNINTATMPPATSQVKSGLRLEEEYITVSSEINGSFTSGMGHSHECLERNDAIHIDEQVIPGAESSNLYNGSSAVHAGDSYAQDDAGSLSFISNPLSFPEYENDSKLGLIFRYHEGIINFWLRHKVTDAAMSDLLKLENAPLTTWKRVREVLYEAEDILIDKHNMCWDSHQHLSVLPNGNLETCSQNICTGRVKQYGYMRIWSRIKCRLQSPDHGPQLFTLLHDALDRLDQTSEVFYRDIFSGSVFRDIVEDVGGTDSVRNDIFLVLSGDGAQPYRSSTYDMWPFVCMIANLPPDKRVKTENMLPIVCIPGPNQPKDVLSFLTPFLDEMEDLSRGVDCTLWDGREVTVRCHMLLLEGDLAALAKLCRLKGHNGLRGCMYCLVHAVRGKHPYFPSFTLAEDHTKETNFDVRAPEMRILQETEKTIAEIEDLRQSKKRGAVKSREEKCKEWGINGRSALFHRSTLIPYRSVPLDYMHLLLINVSSDFVNLLFGREYITRCQEKVINKALSSFGTGVSSQSRNPRPLNQRGLFKADEWRFFVLQSSMVVFDGELPLHIMEGWYLFVQIVDMCGWPALTNDDVISLSTTAQKFYKFYEETFYKGLPEQLNVCKMTLHYILHLADSVRNCGPPLNVSQFPMERFIGETVYGLNARNKAAESVLEHWKFQQSYISYKIKKRIGRDEVLRLPRESLCITSSLPEFGEIVLCHPCRPSSVGKCTDEFGVNMNQLLAEFYNERLGIGISAAQDLMKSHESIKCWDRMAFKSQFMDEDRVVHIGSANRVTGEARRRNYYVAGEYGNGSGEGSNEEWQPNLLIYFGRVQQFFEHRIFFKGTEHVFLLAFVEWVVDELRRGAQGQVFSPRGRDDPALFRNRMVEGVDVMQRHISVVEKEVKLGKQRRHKTYFIDTEMLRDDLLDGGRGKKLCGFRKGNNGGGELRAER